MNDCSSRNRFSLVGRRWLIFAAAFVLGLGLAGASPAMAADCPDGDGDGYAVCGSCDLPAGKLCGDCNDGSAAVKPGVLEVCNGVDDNCDGTVDIPDPDPIVQNDGIYSCVFNVSGPAGECKTGGRAVCVWPVPAGAVPAPPPPMQPDRGLTCVARGVPPIPNLIYADETLSNGTCQDGIDNDCDDVADIQDTGCQQAELCDGIDNDGDGLADETFNIGASCSTGIGQCAKPGAIVCTGPNSSGCSASAGNPKNEGAEFGNSCGNGVDDDCDTFADAADPACAGFGATELCNGADDDGDGTIDEGFPNKGLPCTAGVGACTNAGVFQCSADGSATECSVSAGPAADESETAGTCADFVDNDCDGSADAADGGCGSAYADLGVTCSLPYRTGRPGNDCNGKNIITFDGGQATDVKADLLALSPEGDVLGIIENVQNGEEAQLASRVNLKVDTLAHRYKIHAPVPLLRVVGRKGSVEDVAYCGILPYMELTEPKGVTISLSESDKQEVRAYLPLVNVNTLSVKLDGIDVLAAIGINPGASFPTGAGALCTTAGACVFQVPAGCGDGSMVNVEISNLRVEGLDTGIAPDARAGVEAPDQVNTVSFTVSGLPAGGHIFFLTAQPMPLPRRLATPCHVDDLTDTGTLSAFGIQIDNPVDQQIVATAPVQVQGTVCSGNPIARLRINGGEVDVTSPGQQTCTAGDGVSSADECVVNFDESLPEKVLADAVTGSAVNASYKRGGNRVVADASDDKGNRTFNTEVVFGLGAVQPEALALLDSLPKQAGLRAMVDEVQMAMATEIDPAFVVGLEEAAVQKFFNEKCQGAIDQFSARAQSALSGKTFGTFDVQPDCSCDLNNVPVVLESLTFTPTTANPACAVDFQAGKIGVTVHLPSVHVQVGAHRSCTTRGIFGECVARTKVDLTAVTNVTDISFAFTITETQIETKSPPNKDDFFFTWNIFDQDGNSAINTVGTCANNPERECYGNKKAGTEGAGTSSQCDGGVCNGFVANPSFDPVTHQDVGIECYGAAICTFFEAVAAVLVTIFTFGLVDGFDLIGFLEFDFDVNPDFLDELKAAEPDAMALDEVEVDEGKVSQAGFASFTPGQIDVTIQDGGLTVAFPATFETTLVDPTVPETPPAVATPADAPTVSQLIPVSDDISLLIADDVFNRLFKAMQESGKLKACSNADALTVDQLLPAESAGGCESLPATNVITAGLQGICHAIRIPEVNPATDWTQCLALPESDTEAKTNAKRGACVGFLDGDCTEFPLFTAGRTACAAAPARDIRATDSVIICAREDMAPDLTIAQSASAAPTVQTSLFLEDLNVVFALDRGNDGFGGVLEDLPGCWGADGNGVPDCRLYAACADLTVTTSMGIDSSQCQPNQAGFVFALDSVIPSSLDLGALCSAGTDTDDSSILEEAVTSLVTKAVADNTETFMPPICVDGLDLNNTLDFNSPDARLFGFTTNGGTGFADFLAITVGLATP
jgi:hypothetical protein